MSDWQLIETAPKHDVVILTDGGSIWQGFYQEGLGWITGYDDGIVHVRITLKPTHWLPLEALPKVGSCLIVE